MVKPVATRKFEQVQVVLIGNPGIMSIPSKPVDSVTVSSACYISSSREKNSFSWISYDLFLHGWLKT